VAIQDNPVLKQFLPYQDEIVEKVSQLVGKAASFAAGGLVAGTRGTADFFLKLFIVLFAMFCFLKDGHAILCWVFDRTTLSVDDQQRLIGTFTSVSRATLKGTVVIGIVQGGLAAIAFAVAGIEGVIFWGAVMVLLSIIPAVGTALVWVPAVAYLAMTGRVGTAVALAAWCVIVVGTADNVLRPLLVGKDTKMPDLLVMLTTLGGLALFGAAGIVLGPVIGALFTTVWALWGTALDEAQPDETSAHSEHAH
jgi:predicted PurR-regulated permease PerM